MKAFIFGVIASLGLATGLSAADFDVNTFRTTVETGKLEFSGTVGFGNGVDSDQNYGFGVKGTVFTYEAFGGKSEVNLYGMYGRVVNVETGVIGVEYVANVPVSPNVTLEFGADAAYVMPDGVDNELLVTPNVELTVGLTDSVSAFGGVGYTWIATDDFAAAGGYGELGLDIAVTDKVSIRPSVIRPFDTGGDDLAGALEVNFKF